ncbi:MAG: tetratricopeptide repeat protein, partial [Planctomycetota bacterium]
IQGRVLFLIGRVKASLGDRTEALEVLSEAEAALAEEAAEGPVRESLEVRIRRAEIFLRQPDLAEAERLLDSVRRDLASFDQDVDLWTSWARLEGRLLHQRGDLVAAEELFREALARQLPTENRDRLAVLYGGIALTLEAQGKFDDAADAYRRAMQLNQEIHGDRHESSLVVVQNFAGMLSQTGQLEEAEAMFRDSTKVAREWLGEEHPLHLVSFTNLLSVLTDRGKTKEALVHSDEALRLSEAAWGVDHPRVLILQMNIGNRLLITERFEEAEEMLRIASDGLSARVGPGAPPTLHAQLLLCEVLLQTACPSEVIERVDAALAQAPEGAAPWTLSALRSRRGRAHQALGHFEAAEVELRASYESLLEILGPTAVDTIGAQAMLGQVLLAGDKKADGERLLCDAHELALEHFSEDHATRKELESAVEDLDGCPEP